MSDGKPISIPGLIAVPAVITLGVTILRLVGELEVWPRPWFDTSAGGGAALVGITWLPIIFGPYFALKLSRAGHGWPSGAKAAGFLLLAIIVYVGSGFLAFSTLRHPSYLTIALFLGMLVAAFIPGLGWQTLGKALVAYAFAARIPVLIVMFIAMRAGWVTHYSRVSPVFAHLEFARQYLYEALVPQMTLWMGWTVVVGALCGLVAVAIARPGKQPAPAAA